MNTLTMIYDTSVKVPFSRKDTTRTIYEIVERVNKRVEDEERRFKQALKVALMLELENE